MASSSLSIYYHSLLLIIIIIIIGQTEARPCKTLFISSLTISSFKNPSNPNPNTDPPKFFTIFDFYPTQTHQLQTQPLQIFIDRQPIFDTHLQFPKYPRSMRGVENKPNDEDVSSSSSLRERTKDILSVVVALLFGVGCGALTSATMYLAWSLITNRFEQTSLDDDDDDDDVASFKKMGYSKIPDDASVPAKQVV